MKIVVAYAALCLSASLSSAQVGGSISGPTSSGGASLPNCTGLVKSTAGTGSCASTTDVQNTVGSSVYDVYGAANAITLAGLSPSLAVGTGGVTANHLIQISSGAAVSATGGYGGIAQSTAASGSSVQVSVSAGLIQGCVFENAAVIGDIAIPGTTTQNDCRDSGVTSTSSLPSSTPIIGLVQTSASSGGTANVRLHGLGVFGTQIQAATTPATTLPLCGNTAANSTRACMPGTDYLSPASAPGLNTLAATSAGLNPIGQIWYFEGSSITRGNTLPGAQSPQGGLVGSYPNLVANSIWGSGHGTYYDDGVDGTTSTQVYARYTTGNSSYGGVTVPSAHSVSPSVTSSNTRHIFFLDCTMLYNDMHNGLSLSQSVTNMQNIVSAAQADGWYVVLITNFHTDINGPFQSLQTINTDIRYGIIPCNLFVEAAEWFPNSSDTAFYNSDTIHLNAYGHQIMARNLVAALNTNGQWQSATPVSLWETITFLSGINILNNSSQQSYIGAYSSSNSTNYLNIVGAGSHTSRSGINMTVLDGTYGSNIQYDDLAGKLRLSMYNASSTLSDVMTVALNTTTATFLSPIVIPGEKSGSSTNTDLVGELTFSSTTTGSYTLVGTYTSHPECWAQPQFNAVGNAPWITYTSTTSFTINFATAVTGSVSYGCIGRN